MRKNLIVMAASVVFGASSAFAQVLDFNPSVACGPSACANFGAISQSYGNTSFMDVSYRSVSDFGDTSVVRPNAFYWGPSYGGLSSVVYGGVSLSDVLEIKFVALNGATLSLNGFQSAGWPSTTRNSEFRIYDLNFNQLYSEMFVAPGSGFYQFSCTTCTYANGFILQLGPDGYNVGLDNIDVSATAAPPAIPEPASWALLVAGFGLTGAAMRRREKLVA